MSINIDEDYIDVFLLHNGKKINSIKSELPNYYRIITNNIGVKNEFQDISFTIVNNIELKISIKFKNKFSTKGISVKDILKSINQPKQEQKKTNENQYVPKKLKLPNFLQDNQKKEEATKKEEPKKLEIPKKFVEVPKKNEGLQPKKENKFPKNMEFEKKEETEIAKTVEELE